MFVNMFGKINKKIPIPSKIHFLSAGFRDFVILVRITWFVSRSGTHTGAAARSTYSFRLAKSTNLNLSGRWRDSVNWNSVESSRYV